MAGRVRLLLALLFGVVLLGRSGPEPADAFKIPVHEEILKNGLGDKVSEEARGWVEGYYIALAGTGGAASDALVGQFFPHLHFDSAENPSVICERWQGGVAAPMERAVEAVVRLAQSEKYEYLNQTGVERPGAAEVLRIRRKVAMEQFGTVTHAIADFYAHTNWVELQVARLGVRSPTSRIETAPITGADCRPGDFPADLQSGYASMAWFVARGGAGALAGGFLGSFLSPVAGTGIGAAGGAYASVGWCNPVTGPPSGFRWCHDDLAKDDNSGYGAVYPDPRDPRLFEGKTLHQLAVDLATRSTAAVFEEWHRQVVAAIDDDPELSGVDAECIWRMVTHGTPGACVSCPPEAAGPGRPTGQMVGGGTVAKQTPMIAGTYRGGFTETELDTGASNTNKHVSGAFEAWRLEIGSGPARLTENRIELTADGTGRITGGSMTLQVDAQRSGRMVRGRFEGRVTTEAFTTLQNPTTLFGTVRFEGRVTTTGSGRDRDASDGLMFNYVISRTTGELFLCPQGNNETQCAQLRFAVLTSGQAQSCPVASAASPPPLPQRPAWSGAFRTSFGELRLTAVPQSALGATAAQLDTLVLRRTDAPADGLAAAPASQPNEAEASATPILVVGTYEDREGALIGWANDNRLRGVWFRGPTYTVPDDSGDFAFVLDDDGRSFSGRSNDAATGVWRADWSGTRATAPMAPQAPAASAPLPSAPAPPAPPLPSPAPSLPPSTPPPGAPAATPVGEARIRIEPSQSSYQVGQQIRICYTVPGRGQVVITDILPDGRTRTVISGTDDGAGGCLAVTITEPLGRECVRIDFSNSQGSSRHEVCFEVVRPPTPAPAPPAAGQVRLTIEPNRSAFRVGERFRLCYTVPGPGEVVITDIRPDGTRVVVLAGLDDGRGDCLVAEVTPPTGRECIRIEFRNSRGSSADEVCFQVQR
jgi:hypothetical protein